jgi:S-adenosyl-L-methionine hydrolase (adenosine-forming)
MAIITLTTDFGTKDHFVSAIKGAIHCELEHPIIVDISHEISPFNIQLIPISQKGVFILLV